MTHFASSGIKRYNQNLLQLQILFLQEAFVLLNAVPLLQSALEHLQPQTIFFRVSQLLQNDLELIYLYPYEPPKAF